MRKSYSLVIHPEDSSSKTPAWTRHILALWAVASFKKKYSSKRLKKWPFMTKRILFALTDVETSRPNIIL